MKTEPRHPQCEEARLVHAARRCGVQGSAERLRVRALDEELRLVLVLVVRDEHGPPVVHRKPSPLSHPHAQREQGLPDHGGQAHQERLQERHDALATHAEHRQRADREAGARGGEQPAIADRRRRAVRDDPAADPRRRDRGQARQRSPHAEVARDVAHRGDRIERQRVADREDAAETQAEQRGVGEDPVRVGHSAKPSAASVIGTPESATTDAPVELVRESPGEEARHDRAEQRGTGHHPRSARRVVHAQHVGEEVEHVGVQQRHAEHDPTACDERHAQVVAIADDCVRRRRRARRRTRDRGERGPGQRDRDAHREQRSHRRQ